MTQHRLRLALVFGGRSSEHDVSVVSARAEADIAAEALGASGDRTDEVVPFVGRHRLDPRLVEDQVDVVFPVLHGPWGEDGTIQGVCEILDLPYVGCGVTASAVCMDKALTKRLLLQGGLPTPAWVETDRAAWDADSAKVATRCLELGLPLFVKPARLGSSVGIAKVNRPEELATSVEAALAHDHRLIVEAGVDAREIELAVIGNEAPDASLPGEVVPGHEFYDYEDKYVDSSCHLLAPAPLERDQAEAARRLAVEAYRCLGCDGMARVDLFLRRSDGLFMVNELNTIPGFTSISMYPRLWDISGLPYPELVDRLVELALERHARRRSV